MYSALFIAIALLISAQPAIVSSDVGNKTADANTPNKTVIATLVTNATEIFAPSDLAPMNDSAVSLLHNRTQPPVAEASKVKPVNASANDAESQSEVKTEAGPVSDDDDGPLIEKPVTPDNQPDSAEEDVLDEGDDSAIKNDAQDKKPVGDTDKATKKEKPEKVEKRPVARGDFDDPEDTHFMLYISLVGAVIFLTYIAVHNKKRILGCLIEGRDGQSSSRSRRNVRYRRLSQREVEAGEAFTKAETTAKTDTNDWGDHH